MRYLDGFMAAVPAAKRDAYADHARKAWPIFAKYGAVRMQECWGDDVGAGQVTSMPKAVALQPGEVVVFSWIEWPDKAARDACWAAMDTDPDWAAMGDMKDAPFDGSRMIYGGFVSLLSLP